MAIFEQNQQIIIFTLTACLLFFQVILIIFAFVAQWFSSRESRTVSKEMFGLTRKIEGLTSEKREQIFKAFDKLLETLSNRLPVIIAGEAGRQIFEAESKILQRLAELEPRLKEGDKDNRAKLDELIQTMEGLENTIVNITSDAVHKILLEERKELAASATEYGFNSN